MSSYDFASIEAKWQAYWAENKTFRALAPGDPGFDASKPKAFVLDMFPYPSGKGLHVGHPLGYFATDIVSRYHRMKGYNVLHPMGFDAFGLPAEQYAIETGTHPRVTTDANIENIRRQFKDLAMSYDWDREVATIDPEYYKWTQWIFLQLFDSWFDPKQNKARPIGELVKRMESDEVRSSTEGVLAARGEDGFDALPKWVDLSEPDHHEVLRHHRLAFADEIPVNWCPMLGTVLANEEVTNEGRSERGNYPVFKRPLKQWMLRITKFADRLLEDLDDVDWPESLKLLQRNWIGRSEGARVRFPVIGSSHEIEVFTTRPDTLFGATYMVLAPEHELVDALTAAENRDAVRAYREEAGNKSEIDRQSETKVKTGVFTGATATNPTTGEAIPIWIADYVLMGYGTGAIMAVPAHDHRDFEFAKAFDLPIVAVVDPTDEWLIAQREAGTAPALDGIESGADTDAAAALRQAHLVGAGDFAEAFSGVGRSINSSNDEVSLDGLDTPAAKRKIIDWLEVREIGHSEIQYKLRDWLFSRQRYWGEPFPILHGEDGEVIGVDESELPVELPPMDDFKPTGSDDPDAPPQPALSRAPESWRIVERNGKTYRRELNTMPQWAGSCWYYLRYIDPKNDERLVDPDKESYWMSPGGVDLYVGGVEHAVLHLLYARFWHKALFDLGHVSTPEPFGRLYNQGYIQAYAYQDERGIYVDAHSIEEKDGKFLFEGEEVVRTLGKMGKSLKNSVGPDEVVAQYGCDTLRLYEMYLGPIDASKVWSTQQITGIYRFLQRVWRNFVDEDSGDLRITDAPASEEIRRLLHKTIHQVTQDMDDMAFNTSTARMIELNNALVGLDTLPREVAEPLVLMLAPQAPHFAEELWEKLGHAPSVCYAPWPTYDEAYLVEETIEIVVQVLGKKRGSVQVPADASEEQVQAAALAEESVARHVEGKTIRKVIYVPGRLLNIVAN